MTEPTDRSMPPATITIVMPSAAMPTMAVWRAISSRLTGLKNCGPMRNAEEERDEHEASEDPGVWKPRDSQPTKAALVTEAQRAKVTHETARAPDASSSSVVFRPFRCRPGRTEATARHDRDPIAHGEQFGKVAADDEHGFAGSGRT